MAKSKQNIGWNGKTVKSMLEESEALFKQTGHYSGFRDLKLKEAEPIRYEKIFSRLRGGLVSARETCMNISATPVVQEEGELCFALYTPEGDSVAVSTGILVHIHTMSDAIKHMIRSNYEEAPGINQGDIFTNNDPLIANVHSSDVVAEPGQVQSVAPMAASQVQDRPVPTGGMAQETGQPGGWALSEVGPLRGVGAVKAGRNGGQGLFAHTATRSA